MAIDIAQQISHDIDSLSLLKFQFLMRASNFAGVELVFYVLASHKKLAHTEKVKSLETSTSRMQMPIEKIKEQYVDYREKKWFLYVVISPFLNLKVEFISISSRIPVMQ